ncbi:MAG: hypothetical protein JWO33_1077, partial [Caulobacteraceae bacterium]|nr:hypothetical protein [Caulobacteraceae bacterium]
EENKRNKRFYTLSPHGHDILARLLEEQRALIQSLNIILQEKAP